MATVRIHYSRDDNSQSDYDLIYFDADMAANLDHNQLKIPYYPRTKLAFGDNSYVDIEVNNKVSFYIKRKDGVTDHNGELCTFGSLECGPTCTFCWEIGYQWTIDLNIAPYSEFYINNSSPYIYKTSSQDTVVAVGTAFIGEEDQGDGEADVSIEDDYIRIFYSLNEYKDVFIPEEERWATKYMPWTEYWKDDIPRVQMLYLLNKSYTVGENDMNLSIDADALAIEKADAKQTLERAIANCLYKLGEDIAAFDEDAFLADVDAYKATKNEIHGVTIDYLKQSLEAHAALA